MIGAVSFFFARSLANNWQELEGVEIGFSSWSVLATLFFALAVMASGALWGDILNRLSPSDKRVTPFEAMRVHIMSWLLKYIPGQAGSYLSKVAWGQKHHYSKKLISITFVYENAFLLFASMIGSLPVLAILFHDRISDNIVTFLPLLLAIPLLLLLQKDIFYRLVNFAFTKLRRQPVEKSYFLNTPQLFSYTIKFLVPRLITAVAFLCVVASLTPVPPEAYVGLMATYILAGIIGLMAVFVPSGLGVREAVIVLFASAYFPVEVAVILAVAARLYATIADGLLAAVYLLIRKRGNKG